MSKTYQEPPEIDKKIKRHPSHEEYVARLLLLGIPYTTLSNGNKRWYVTHNYVTYKVIGIYKFKNQISMFNEQMLLKGLADPSKFTTMLVHEVNHWSKKIKESNGSLLNDPDLMEWIAKNRDGIFKILSNKN